jgi:hypothetical protein
MQLAAEEDGARIIRHVPCDLTSFTLDVGPFDDDLEEHLLEGGDDEENGLLWSMMSIDFTRHSQIGWIEPFPSCHDGDVMMLKSA